MPRQHGLRSEVHGLLARTALAVDRHAGHVVGEPGGQPRGARDVAGLRAERVDAAEDHVVDQRGVDAGAIDERFDDVRAEVGRVHRGERAAAPADGRAHGVDDVGLSHGVSVFAMPSSRMREVLVGDVVERSARRRGGTSARRPRPCRG